MKLQRHITSKSYLFKVIVEHLMTLCWGIAETITAWALNLLNLFMLPNWRKPELYWKANRANISSCSKKTRQKNLLITGDLSEVDDLLSAYTLQLPVWLIHASLCGKLWKKSKENILYFKSWVELILFRITRRLNILFVSDFFLFLFMSMSHFFNWLVTTT